MAFMTEMSAASWTAGGRVICGANGKRFHAKRGTKKRGIRHALRLSLLMNAEILLSLFEDGFQSDRQLRRGCFLNRVLPVRRDGKHGAILLRGGAIAFQGIRRTNSTHLVSVGIAIAHCAGLSHSVICL
jgi:hypothetical protein